VLADVSGSYREAITGAAAMYGVTLTPDEIWAAKRRGNANNDWVLTRDLLRARGVDAPLQEVTDRFEALYQGTDEMPGLWANERLMVDREWLVRLAARRPLAIVTGRPRLDCERFLRQHDIADLFQAVVVMQDAPLKPDPAPVYLALRRLGVSRAWMLGDTPDDVRAARGAGVVPLGVVGPGESAEAARATLLNAGAARVLDRVEDLEALLP
jgi:HAD superfamily hydrolase (TIGR01548 family)